MKIKSITVKNFGPLKCVTLPCDPLTILVGKNGVGKSTVLRALNLFYNTNINVDERDYYNKETDKDIIINIKFTDLSENEMKVLKIYIKGDEFSVEKVISYNEGRIQQRYHGSRFINPVFSEFRKAGGTDMRREYNKFKDEYAFIDYTNRDNADATCSEWEIDNKEKCIEERDDGQFFGFQNVGTHRLEGSTKFIFVPAVHDAQSEGVETRGSSILQIMDLVVKGVLASDPEFIEIETEAKKKYNVFIERAKTEQLSQISSNLTKTLNVYFPDTIVNLDWIEEQGVSINPPRAIVRVEEEGYENTIEKCGHGLQRAFILTMFQELALIQAKQFIESAEDGGELKQNPSLPGLIIGIEEPELYQHPDRQRHLIQTLFKLTEGGIEGVGNIQVIYTTHSPLMVDYLRFNQLRIFNKVKIDKGKPKQTQITFANLRKAASLVESAKGDDEGSYTDESFRQRLISLMTPWMNEGFFAKIVVLVEGIKDRALIVGQAINRDIFFDTMGIAVIPCSGKNNMPEAISIFNSLNIPLYTIWDSDFKPDKDMKKGEKAAHARTNQNILRCHGCTPEDFPCMKTNDFICIKTNLEKEFRDEIGLEKYDKILQTYCDQRELGQGQYVMQNPLHVSELLTILQSSGFRSNILNEIIDKILKKYRSIG